MSKRLKQMQNYTEKAKEIIAKNIYMTIATATRDGEPWISPVFFAYDNDYNLFWTSEKESRHSRLIRENGRVAIVVFDSSAPEGEGDGVYFEANAAEINDPEEAKQAMALFSARATQDEFKVWKVEEVTGDGAWRMYKATPHKISKLTEGEYVNEQYVDRRIEISLGANQN